MIIHKYTFSDFEVETIGNVIPIELPVGTKILDLQIQNNEFVLWYTVPSKEDDKGNCVYDFMMAFTGNTNIPKNAVHIKTLIHPTGLVFHLFKL